MAEKNPEIAAQKAENAATAQQPSAAAVTAAQPAAPAAKPATVAETEPANPADRPDNTAGKPAAKPAKPKKDPAAPTLVPFQLITQRNRERLAAIGRADDKTLGELLDAYEKRSVSAAVPAAGAEQNTGSLLNTIKQLKQKISAQEQTIADKEQEIAAKKQQLAAAHAAEPSAEDNSESAETIQLQQVEIAAQKQKIADLSAELSSVKQELQQKQQQITEAAGGTADSQQLKELKNRCGQMEEELKENRKILRGREEQAAAYERKVAKLEHTVTELRNTNADLQQQLDARSAAQYRNPDGFLDAFEPVVAKLLQATADKMTDMRTDGIQVIPSMILGDMFLKYTLQKRTMWFYRWVLSDTEIVDIAKEINPNINSVRMLRRVLDVDKELN